MSARISENECARELNAILIPVVSCLVLPLNKTPFRSLPSAALAPTPRTLLQHVQGFHRLRRPAVNISEETFREKLLTSPKLASMYTNLLLLRVPPGARKHTGPDGSEDGISAFINISRLFLSDCFYNQTAASPSVWRWCCVAAPGRGFLGKTSAAVSN